jgi:large subunit ribosomal protein L5
MSIGIKEHTIFPETGDEEIVNVFGLAITIVTSAKSRPEALAFFEYLGFPLKKEDENEKASCTRKRGK